MAAARALRSTVNTAVLCLVLQRPGNGYEIGRRFVSRYGAFFRSSQRHIYSSLERLEQQGLIEATPADGPPHDGGPGFRATASGARAYKAWLLGGFDDPYAYTGAWFATVDPGEVRRELLVRWISIRPDDRQSMLELLDRHEEIVLRMATRAPIVLDSVVDQLALDERELTIQSLLRWITLARERLRAAERAELRPV